MKGKSTSAPLLKWMGESGQGRVDGCTGDLPAQESIVGRQFILSSNLDQTIKSVGRRRRSPSGVVHSPPHMRPAEVQLVKVDSFPPFSLSLSTRRRLPTSPCARVCGCLSNLLVLTRGNDVFACLPQSTDGVEHGGALNHPQGHFPCQIVSAPAAEPSGSG